MSDEVGLKTFVDADELKRDIAINPTDLDTAMIEHPSLYVHYATQTVNARRQHERLKSAFEILEARLDKHYRESFAEEGKKVTENVIRSAIVTDSRWATMNARVIEAQSIWKLCEVAERAFDQRKDMILEVARDRRKEKEGAMRVLEQTEARERVLDMISKKNAA